MCLFSLSGFAQEKGYLEFAGRTIRDTRPLAGAKITVYKSGVKMTELITNKNGKFMFDLDLGFDYKITFSYPGCVDMYAMVYGSKYTSDKAIFPIYDIDVAFFDLGKSTINYANFKNPFTKVIYDGKKSFRDDEPYVDEFIRTLYIDPEEVKKKEDERLALEKAEREKELKAKMKLEEDERMRLEQIMLAEKRSKEDAEALAKLMEEKNRQEKKNEANSSLTQKQNESNQSLVKEEVKLTIEKEQKKVKEKQNKAIKANYENDLLKLVAQNERQLKENDFKKGKNQAETNEVIETLKQEAIVKAKSDETRFNMKMKNKQAVLNSRIRNQELTGLIKDVAYHDLSFRASHAKKLPEARSYRARSMVGITTDLESQTFKSVYTITVFESGISTVYRKEKYNWGLTYYFRNDKEITEADYFSEVSQYNIAL
ncbi:MAG: hypothetical protein ACJ76F_11970 [Bacteroidia bacterium]